MPQHVVVSGAAGYIGRHVVAALLERGARVTAVVRPGSAARVPTADARPSGSLDVIELDLLDPGTDLGPLASAAPDAYVHLAWEQGFAHNAPAHIERLGDHYRVLRTFAEGGAKRLAVLGSMHEVGYHEGAIAADTPTHPQSLYGIAKDALRRAAFLSLEPVAPVQWLRAFYIFGDDRRNQSIFTKLLQAADEGRRTFPFTSGTKQYDFIRVDELGRQIAATVSQDAVTGIINVCSGEARSLGEIVERFIVDEGLDIALEYGAFPDRPYDSPRVFGDASEIRRILAGTPR